MQPSLVASLFDDRRADCRGRRQDGHKPRREAGIDTSDQAAAAGGARRARNPRHLSREALVEIAHDVRRDLLLHNTALLAAGIAFRAFLALFPTLIVVVTAIALARPAADLAFQARRLTIGLPDLGRQVIIAQVDDIALADNQGLQIAFLVSLAIALWAATSALQGTMHALTTTQHGVEHRSWLAQRLLALRLTAGALPFLALSVVLVTGVPVVMHELGLGGIASTAGVLATFVTLAVMMVSALTILYRVGPARPAVRTGWASAGAMVATFLWLAGTQAFKLGVEGLGTYDARYGAVAGVAVIMLWLWLTSFCVLLGATVNARLEEPVPGDPPAT